MENISKIYYINLAKRVDRNDHMIKLLTPYRQKVERFDAIYDTYGAIGCSASHIAILKMAIRDKLNNVMICEDDYVIPDINVLEQKLKIFFDDGIQWNVLVVCGVLLKKTLIANNTSYCKTTQSRTTTCYIVNNNYFLTLLDNYESGLVLLKQSHNKLSYAIDMFAMTLQKNDHWYCLNPTIGYQMPGYSDIEQQKTNYLRYFEKCV